jgi:hypothetical protein
VGRATWEACSSDVETWELSQHSIIDTGKHKPRILHKTLCWYHKHVEFYIHDLLFISLVSTVLFPYLCLDLWPWHRVYWPVVSHQCIWPILSVRCFMELNFVLRWFRVRKFWAVLPGSSLRPHLNGSLYAHVVAPLNTASMSLMSLLYCK